MKRGAECKNQLCEDLKKFMDENFPITEIMEKFDLNQMESTFVYHYICNGKRRITYALEKAGYSKSFVKNGGKGFIKKPKIKAAVNGILRQMSSGSDIECSITKSKIIKTLNQISFGGLRDALTLKAIEILLNVTQQEDIVEEIHEEEKISLDELKENMTRLGVL